MGPPGEPRPRASRATTCVRGREGERGLTGSSLARRSFRAAAAATRSGEASGARTWTLQFLLAAIRLYQLEISSKRRACCRFTPSCSHYAAEALDQHGLRHGLWLTARRLLRCRPGTTGGSDPVPARVPDLD
ncbi:MAG: membrane protein insertion efficiency factor YidD [Propionibacteriaceae bacterium]|nr:membrane protein insertion efficiency factor YidD [Propionibacteriaceae bacterium]